MWKKLSFISVAVLLLAYMIVAVAFIAPKATTEEQCAGLSVEVVDASDRQFISAEEVEAMIKAGGLNPKGRPLAEVNTAQIEDRLMQNRIIRRADCYKTVDGTVKIKIYQRTPFVRVFPVGKGSYYIDRDREIIPASGVYPAYVPVVSGFVADTFACRELFDFIEFIQKDRFWNAQIAQIYVAQNGDIELTPTVGNHQIILGQLSDYREKLEKLRIFYDKGLNRIGWNKYSVINLKYRNQVVCK
jgi:cell division protein FtsQ